MKPRSRTLWIPVAILVALVPVFAGLGGWQLHRADQKERLQAEYDRRVDAAPLRVAGRAMPADELKFRRVIARGSYDSSYQILMDNRVHHRQPGYHVVTPFRIENTDMRILVNRGWVPLGVSREVLPDVDPPSGTLEIKGVAMIPSDKAFTLGGTDPVSRSWQPVWPRLDMKQYAALVPFIVQPGVVLLDADAAGGYLREWSRLDTGIALHYGYAFQWFALAALAVGIAAWLGYRLLHRSTK
jgi:surfeit locus 1 family protein